MASRASYSVSTPRWANNNLDNTLKANDPAPKKSVPNVSATNAVPVDSMGAFDGRLVESPEEAEQNRQLQAPNRATTWAKSQRPREEAMTGPRFEQTIMHHQVSHGNPLIPFLNELARFESTIEACVDWHW